MSTAGDSQESGSPPPSPTDSATSDSAPTLVHIKQEAMPPGNDVKEYYGNVDFGLPDTYLPSNFSDYRRYLPRPLDLPNQGFDKDKDDLKEEEEDRNLLLPTELSYKNGGIFSRVNIPVETKYGPFVGKWEKQPLDRRFAWEVSLYAIIYICNYII